MANPNSQQLFLLEFLVEKVNIPSVQAIKEDLMPVKTCIEFRVLNLPPLFICQDEMALRCNCLGPDPQVFRKGKSCLFALPLSVLNPPICSFPVGMSVFKKLPPSVLPDVMAIGGCLIELCDMLNALLTDKSRDCLTLKNDFRISTPTGQSVGEVTLYIRFSYLGKHVVTQFQTPHNRKPYLFKALGESPVFQCRRVPSVVKDQDNPFKTCSCEEKDADDKPNLSNFCGGPVKEKKANKCKKKKPCCQPKKQRCPPPSNTFNLDSSEKTVRQCGCEVKEEKSYCCK